MELLNNSYYYISNVIFPITESIVNNHLIKKADLSILSSDNFLSNLNSCDNPKIKEIGNNIFYLSYNLLRENSLNVDNSIFEIFREFIDELYLSQYYPALDVFIDIFNSILLEFENNKKIDLNILRKIPWSRMSELESQQEIYLCLEDIRIEVSVILEIDDEGFSYDQNFMEDLEKELDSFIKRFCVLHKYSKLQNK